MQDCFGKVHLRIKPGWGLGEGNKAILPTASLSWTLGTGHGGMRPGCLDLEWCQPRGSEGTEVGLSARRPSLPAMPLTSFRMDLSVSTRKSRGPLFLSFTRRTS